jgi:uncharacterized RDD family membrane protein YckC
MEEHVASEFWKRALASIIEILILCIPLVYTYRYLNKLSYELGTVVPFIIYWIVFIAILVFLTVRYGGSIGKLILGYRIVDENGKYLSTKQAIIRYYPYILNSIILILIFNETLMHRVNPVEAAHYKGNYSSIQSIIGLLYIIDILAILFNRRKRAFHDFLANSYVVTKNFIPSDYLEVSKVEEKTSF